MSDEEIPSGGSLSPGPAMPVPAPPSLPGGNMLQSLGAGPTLPSPGPSPMMASDPIGGIVNAIQSSIGYATQDPNLQKQAMQRETLRQQYAYTAAAHAGIMQAMDKLAAGDTQGARDVLKANPAVLFSPEGMQLYGKTAELDRAIAQHKASVSVLSGRGDVWSQLAGGILQSDPTMSTKDAMTQATDILKLNKVEKADDGFHIISPTGQPIGFIPTVKLMTKKREESIIGVGGAGAGSQPTIVAGEQQPVDYFHTLPTETRAGLLATKGFDTARYNMLAKQAADSPEGDNTELRTWNRIGEITADMRKNPIEWQAAAARLGITPEEQATPSMIAPPRMVQWQDAVQNAKTAQEVRSAQGMHEFKVADMFAPDAFPSSRGMEMVDKNTFQSEPTAAVHGDVYKTRMESGQWVLANPESARAAKFANGAMSGVQGAQTLVSRIFHDLGPAAKDMRLDDAWKLWSSKFTASSEDATAYRALKVSLATEIGKALNPQGRGSDQARKEIEDILPGGFRLETLGTANASLNVVKSELDNRRRAVLGLPLSPIQLPEHITWKTYGGKTYGSTNPFDPKSWFEKSTPDPYGATK